MVELLGLVWAIALIYLGAVAASWWYVPAGALVGLALYALMRQAVILRHLQRGNIVVAVTGYYGAQLITASLFFLIGRGLGALWG